jgi:broad specificity phosphatase PhoE
MTPLRRVLLAAFMLVTVTTTAAAQATIFLVRHAERADGGSMGTTEDPSISAAGRARAKWLATMLKDTKLTEVFATQYKRTQQTALPTAQAQGLTVTTINSDRTASLVERLKGATGTVLVVGHSGSVPEIIAALGITTPVTIDETEFDNFFVVLTGAEPRLLRFRYR